MLLFGAHPDDVEWGAGGSLILLQKQGVRFAMIDLTAGEMGSRGTVAERKVEAQAAATFCGAAARETLSMPDCGLQDTPDNRMLIARTIRRFRPQIVAAPYWEDRHPDHAATGSMVRNSALFCTLRKLDNAEPPHKPELFLYYLLHNFSQPTFVTDVSEVYQSKLQLLRIHQTQFAKTAAQSGLLSQGMSDHLYGLESRDRFFGSLIGCTHGEAFVQDRATRLHSLSQLLTPGKSPSLGGQ